MPYTPQTWNNNDGSTPLSAARLTVMENGIAAASGGVFNVKDTAYGAAGDGVADDTTAVQAAITAAQTAGGGIVYIPEGIYKITAALTVTAPNVHIIGAGWDQATLTSGSILKAGAAITHIVSVSSAGTHFAVEAVSLDQAGQATNGLTVDGLNAQVFQCHARNPATNGVGFNVTSGGTSAWFTNCRFNGANATGCTAWVINGTDSIMVGCKGVNCVDAVQYLGGASGAQQVACHHTPGSPIGRCAIFINGNPSNITINSNRIDNHVLGSAIQISPTANVQGFQICDNLFFQNTITDATFAAVGVDTTSGSIRQLVIAGNVIKSAASHNYTALLTAQTLAGAAATNPTRISSAGTIANDNSVFAAAMFGASSQPMSAKGNVLTTDGSTYALSDDGTPRADIVAAAAGLVSEPFPLRTAQNTANVATQGLYAGLCGFKKGDVITNVVVFAPTVGTVSLIFGAVYDLAGNQLAVSADFHASWAAGINIIPLGTPYTVPSDQALYLAFNSTWSVQPTLVRGISQSTPTIGSGAKIWVQQTGQASPPAPATFVASGLGALWIAAT